MRRSSGVLLHISSLPGPFGAGCFGPEAVEFARQIHDAGFSFWQVLPFSQPGNGDSPYQSFSAFAGNYYFIDPRQLLEQGLISPADLEEAKYKGEPYSVDFPWLMKSRSAVLRKAYANITEAIVRETELFLSANPWADDVALYQTIKDEEDNKPWWEWKDPGLRLHDENAMNDIRESRRDEYLFYCYVEYEFNRQWMSVKKKINGTGVQVIGDIPIYVSDDSADVWANSDLFLVNPDHTFSSVAGVPPDYFCADGQLWGNPLYNWNKHRETGYEWWLLRLKVNFERFDQLRIDHFRGFSSYWSVDAKEKTARNGVWMKGPGMNLFDRVKEVFPDSPIIAEDLGEIDDDVRDFLEQAGFPGMHVLQFGFDPNGDSTNLPHHYENNSVAYTGTHDNNTILGWLWDASPEEREFALKYCGVTASDWGAGGPDSPSCRGMLRQVWQSHAGLVIVPVQDLLGYGKDTRMNIPGTPEGNWTFRVTSDAIKSMNSTWLLELNRLYRRCMVSGV